MRLASSSSSRPRKLTVLLKEHQSVQGGSHTKRRGFTLSTYPKKFSASPLANRSQPYRTSIGCPLVSPKLGARLVMTAQPAHTSSTSTASGGRFLRRIRLRALSIVWRSKWSTVKFLRKSPRSCDFLSSFLWTGALGPFPIRCAARYCLHLRRQRHRGVLLRYLRHREVHAATRSAVLLEFRSWCIGGTGVRSSRQRMYLGPRPGLHS